ncbi:unnamed protein product [Blepharisma stoltei]|uniref:Uncharacterized protein n=1 Tax=Blepharisma stoltei TaxID=1481888 RepID=A0AAU9IRN5_9CILI|nr:unnamed protein product [Blepharisma stoltei]
MATKRCFVQSCGLEVHYACLCLSPEIYSCEFHIGEHLKVPKRTHNIVSVYLEPCTETKDAVLGFLLKEKLKKEKLKAKIASSFSQNLFVSENSLEESLRKLDSDLYEISSWIEKISQTQKISKFDEDPLLQLLTLEPGLASEKVKEMIPAESETYNNVKYFCSLNKEIEKIIENYIKNKFEALLDKKLSNLEKRLGESDKKNNEKIENVNHSILELVFESKKNKKIIENLNQENHQIQIESIQTQLNSALSLIRKTETEMNQLKSQINQNISHQLLILQELQAKKSEILSRTKNSQEIEQEFRKTCKYQSLYSNYSPMISQAYQEYINAYHQNTSLYLIKICS